MIEPEFDQYQLFQMREIGMASTKKLMQEGGNIADVACHFIHQCQANAIPIQLQPFANRSIDDLIVGGLHELDDSISIEIFIYGPHNRQKDLFLKRLLDESAFSKLQKGCLPVGEDANLPEARQCIIRLPFSEGDGGIVFVNALGLGEDDLESSESEDATRRVLGLPTLTEEVKVIGFMDAGKDPLEPEWLAVEDIETRFSAENRVVIYLLDAASTTAFGSASQERIRNDVETLHEKYGDRLIVCLSNSDTLQSWKASVREKRQATLDRIFGDLDTLAYLDKQSILPILKAMLSAADVEPELLLTALLASLEKSRFTYSLQQFSGILTSLLGVDQDQPYSHFRAGITLILELYCMLYHGVSTEAFLQRDGKIEKILTSANDGITSWDRLRTRKPRGLRERLTRFWKFKVFYETVTTYKISNAALAEICALLYSLIYFLQNFPDPLIPEIEAERFFREYLEKHDANILLKAPLQRIITHGFIAFFQKYHPQTLDFRTKLSRCRHP